MPQRYQYSTLVKSIGIDVLISRARFIYIYRNHSYQNKRIVNTSDVLMQLSVITRLCHRFGETPVCLFVLILNDTTFSRNCKLLKNDTREHKFAYLTFTNVNCT